MIKLNNSYLLLKKSTQHLLMTKYRKSLTAAYSKFLRNSFLKSFQCYYLPLWCHYCYFSQYFQYWHSSVHLIQTNIHSICNYELIIELTSYPTQYSEYLHCILLLTSYWPICTIFSIPASSILYRDQFGNIWYFVNFNILSR